MALLNTILLQMFQNKLKISSTELYISLEEVIIFLKKSALSAMINTFVTIIDIMREVLDCAKWIVPRSI